MRTWLIIASVLYICALPFVVFFAALAGFLYDSPDAGGTPLAIFAWIWITIPISFLLGGTLHWVAYALKKQHAALVLSLLPVVHGWVWFVAFFVFVQTEG